MSTDEMTNHTPPIVIVRTPRLVLRQFHAAHVGALARVFGDPEVMRFGDGQQTVQWVREWVARWGDTYYAAWGFGMWAVAEREGRDAIGYCGLSRFPGRCATGEAEIGFRLARAYWGRGYATEAARAVRDYAFVALGLPRLIVLVDPGNAASIRVTEKIGMRYEREVSVPGYSHPDRLYSVAAPSRVSSEIRPGH